MKKLLSANMKIIKFFMTLIFLMFQLVPCVRADTITMTNLDWEIILTDYGYSDLLFDKTPGRDGREYLSGEWAGAVRYDFSVSGTDKAIWFEPDFIFPDWTTNSNFSVTTSIYITGSNLDGLPVAESTISNPDLIVHIDYEMLDKFPGIEQGEWPASDSSTTGFSTTSNRYILEQIYTITNISGQVINDLQFYQFLHGLNSQIATFDDRFYGGPSGTYKYDITERGITDFWYNTQTGTLELIDDVITFHSEMEPTAWETGYYGVTPTDDHVFGKPTIGVHLSVESDTLAGTDFFAPPELWVSGAQKYSLGSLNNGESTSFTALLSIQSTYSAIPEPSSLGLLALGVLGLAWRRRKRKKRKRKV